MCSDGWDHYPWGLRQVINYYNLRSGSEIIPLVFAGKNIIPPRLIIPPNIIPLLCARKISSRRVLSSLSAQPDLVLKWRFYSSCGPCCEQCLAMSHSWGGSASRTQRIWITTPSQITQEQGRSIYLLLGGVDWATRRCWEHGKRGMGGVPIADTISEVG